MALTYGVQRLGQSVCVWGGTDSLQGSRTLCNFFPRDFSMYFSQFSNTVSHFVFVTFCTKGRKIEISKTDVKFVNVAITKNTQIWRKIHGWSQISIIFFYDLWNYIMTGFLPLLCQIQVPNQISFSNSLCFTCLTANFPCANLRDL